MAGRFNEAVSLRGSHTTPGDRRYYVDLERVSAHVFAELWLAAHKKGKLGVPVTQSTGFGYRIITEIL